MRTATLTEEEAKRLRSTLRWYVKACHDHLKDPALNQQHMGIKREIELLESVRKKFRKEKKK